MILSEETKLSPKGNSIKYYKELGYKIEHGKTISVKISDLPLSSHGLINVKCDICGKEKQLEYMKYIKNTKNFTSSYCCSEFCAKDKIKETNLGRHGCINPFQNKIVKDKIKQANIEKYGVEYPTQSEEIRLKIKNNNIINYGVENPLQVKEFFEKSQKNAFLLKTHEQTGLKYRGTYEKHFLDYCFDNKVCVENYKSIKYEFEGKTKIYYPDFYLKNKNLIIEVKSKYIYEKDLDKNLAKQLACLNQGYNFIFIIDKIYEDFENIIQIDNSRIR